MRAQAPGAVIRKVLRPFSCGRRGLIDHLLITARLCGFLRLQIRLSRSGLALEYQCRRLPHTPIFPEWGGGNAWRRSAHKRKSTLQDSCWKLMQPSPNPTTRQTATVAVLSAGVDMVLKSAPVKKEDVKQDERSESTANAKAKGDSESEE